MPGDIRQSIDELSIEVTLREKMLSVIANQAVELKKLVTLRGEESTSGRRAREELDRMLGQYRNESREIKKLEKEKGGLAAAQNSLNRAIATGVSGVEAGTKSYKKFTRDLDKSREAIKKIKEGTDQLTDAQKRTIAVREEEAALLEDYVVKSQKMSSDIGAVVKALGVNAKGMAEVLGAGAFWAMATEGVISFAKAVREAHEELRALRNEGIWLGGITTGGGEGRFGEAGSFMAGARALRWRTGYSEKEQAQLLGTAARTGIVTNIENQAYNQEMMGGYWALGKGTGMAPEALMGMGRQMMIGGIERTQLPQALLDMANNARAAGEGVEVYMNNVLQLNAMTRRYGTTLEENEEQVRLFAKGLQAGTVSLQDLAQLSGAGLGAPENRGARAFLANMVTSGNSMFAGPEFAGARATYTGMGPFQAQAQMRSEIESGKGEDYTKMASRFAAEFARGRAGLKGGAEFTPEATDFYSMMMQQLGITTPKLLESAKDFEKAASQLRSPTELLRTAAEGFMSGQNQLEKNIGELIKRAETDYDRMLSLQERMERMLDVHMTMLVFHINDFLKIFGVGLFAGREGEAVRRGFVGEMATQYKQFNKEWEGREGAPSYGGSLGAFVGTVSRDYYGQARPGYEGASEAAGKLGLQPMTQTQMRQSSLESAGNWALWGLGAPGQIGASAIAGIQAKLQGESFWPRALTSFAERGRSMTAPIVVTMGDIHTTSDDRSVKKISESVARGVYEESSGRIDDQRNYTSRTQGDSERLYISPTPSTAVEDR